MAKKKNVNTNMKMDDKCRNYLHQHCLNTVSEHHTRIAQLCNVDSDFCNRGDRDEGIKKTKKRK